MGLPRDCCHAGPKELLVMEMPGHSGELPESRSGWGIVAASLTGREASCTRREAV